MKIVLPMHRNRVSPVFDVSRRFLIVNVNVGKEVTLDEVLVENTDPIIKAKRIAELEANVLICGAISWPLEAVLASAGVEVISNTCGLCEEVANAFLEGRLTDRAFLMPGCSRRNRNRRRKQTKQ